VRSDEEQRVFSLAEAADIPDVLALYRSLVGTSGCAWNSEYPNKQIVEQDVAAGSLYILREDGELLAAAFAGDDDELDGLPWQSRHPCNLSRLGVVLSRQGSGIGSFMVQSIKDAVRERGYDGIILIASKSNPSALALYDKNGFTRCGETEMYGIAFSCYELLL
jgi:ribosomal protein S18 acetylase RimI-like enzyme